MISELNFDVMKPKYRVYCAQGKRCKILFETEKKAQNFLKFNTDAIIEESGHAPIRVYYCPSCGGYHVTSKPKYS